MSEIENNISLLKQRIPSTVKLVAVSKTMLVEDIYSAYRTGLRCFGENRVQELLSKKDRLPPDIEWHAIGHLQTNKVKVIVPFISMIQSVDSVKLLKTIDKEAAKISRTVDCLLQIHIASEETKFGFNLKELEKLFGSEEFLELKHVRICGLMGMATFTSDTTLIRKEFKILADCFKSNKERWFKDKAEFCEISMGMSGDYETAISEGSTIVRIGSLIFGERKQI